MLLETPSLVSPGLHKIAACHLASKGIKFDIRGPGCMIGFEALGLPKGACAAVCCAYFLLFHRNGSHAGTYLSKELQKSALQHNLMLLTCGNDTIRFALHASFMQSRIRDPEHFRFIPPLTVSSDEMDEGLQKVLAHPF
jgi:4-aminobutyrate aminotransferase-like enzyme